jgi:hypothetical protein
VIPERVLEHTKFTPLRAKAWERFKFAEASIKDHDDSFPLWLKIEVSQNLSAEDHFILAQLIRYTSEHPAKVKLTRAIQQMFPTLPGGLAHVLGNHINGRFGHAVATSSFLDGDKPILPQLVELDMRTRWEKATSPIGSFHQLTRKTRSVDSFFVPPMAGRPLMPNAMHVSWSSAREKVTHNGVTIEAAYPKLELLFSKLEKELSA